MKKTIPVNVGKRMMFFFLCMYSMGIFAQNITVTGLVTDTKNEPLIGVTIRVVGESEKGTVTDFDGRYVLPHIPQNAQIEVSYVGMEKQVIDVKGRTIINDARRNRASGGGDCSSLRCTENYSFMKNQDHSIDVTLVENPPVDEIWMTFQVPVTDEAGVEHHLPMCDYASAGNSWKEGNDQRHR